MMYRCNHCGTMSTAESINYCTIKACCVNRKQKREFIPIERTKQGDHRWYKCPLCDKNLSRRSGWCGIVPTK